MEIEKLRKMGIYTLYSTEWRDSRDEKNYHMRTIVRGDCPLVISATGEDAQGNTKTFTIDDFVEHLSIAE